MTLLHRRKNAKKMYLSTRWMIMMIMQCDMLRAKVGWIQWECERSWFMSMENTARSNFCFPRWDWRFEFLCSKSKISKMLARCSAALPQLICVSRKTWSKISETRASMRSFPKHIQTQNWGKYIYFPRWPQGAVYILYHIMKKMKMCRK